MTGEKVDGNNWLREQRRRQTDPAERTATREALMRRLFGDPEPEPDGSKPNDGPDAA